METFQNGKVRLGLFMDIMERWGVCFGQVSFAATKGLWDIKFPPTVHSTVLWHFSLIAAAEENSSRRKMLWLTSIKGAGGFGSACVLPASSPSLGNQVEAGSSSACTSSEITVTYSPRRKQLLYIHKNYFQTWRAPICESCLILAKFSTRWIGVSLILLRKLWKLGKHSRCSPKREKRTYLQYLRERGHR